MKMDAKEIKAALKAAREAIRTKDFETSAKHCKNVLEADKKNYNALVFMGVAADGLNQIEQALKAYRTAVEEVPDQPLAWQGFGSLLEKHSTIVEPPEAIKVFEKLLTFNAGDEGKQISVSHRLANLYFRTKMYEESYHTLSQLLAMESGKEGRFTACCLLVDLFNSDDFKVEGHHLEQYFKCLNEILDKSSLSQEELNKYIKLLLCGTANHNVNLFPSKCEEMRKRFPDAEATLEFSLHFELQRLIGVKTVPAHDVKLIEDLFECLNKLNSQNSVVSLAAGFLELQKRDYLPAKKILSEISPGSICGYYFLAKSSIALHNNALCLETCAKGLAVCGDMKVMFLVPVTSIADSFKLLRVEALIDEGSHEDLAMAVASLEELKEANHEEVTFLLSACYLDQGKETEAETFLKELPQESVQAKILTALVHAKNERNSQALEILRAVVDADKENPFATLKLGIILWNLKDSDQIDNVKQLCFNTLLKAAKLDPYNYESFLYLGHFYQLVQKDLNKARRCFQKAFDLNSSKDDTGCALVDILLEINEKDQAVAILKDITSKSAAGRGKWAWLRLGLYQIKFEDPTIAIASLQSALRADPKDHHIWECLAEAYLHRGSLTAALKAFTKASELKPDSVYCQYQMASVRQTLGLLPQAILEYKQILEKEHNYVPALKGLGESLVLLAKQHLHQCLDGLAQDCCEEALVYLSRAAVQRPDFTCSWKLMGDACNVVCNMASDSYRVPSKMLSKGNQNTEMSQATKIQVLELGSRCYSAAIKILSENGSLWHDLGVSLYHQCKETTRQNAASKEGDIFVSQELLERAKKAMKKAVTLEPTNWQHWNALGVMACCKVNYKPSFAQHCFIKSIECEANNVLAWSNLGSLYLSEHQIQMAHDAFKVAQRLDPTCVIGWIGQALIAEIVGHEEVMDLFRHTTDLAAHPESQLGYAQFVLATLRDEAKLGTELFNYCIHQMAAVPAASDALVKYCVRVKNDAIAYNMLGLLFEQQNLLESSIDSFLKALKLLSKNDPQNVRMDVQINYARVLCKQGKYKESVDQFGSIADHLDFQHLCCYGLAEYKCSNFLQSLKVYQFALERCPDYDAVRSQLYAVQGMVAFKAGDQEEAKSQLFNGFQTQSPSFHGLLALCALGLLQGDMTLATAVINELDKRPDPERFSVQAALLQLYAHFIQGSKTKGECMLRDMLEQRVPDASPLWNLLASYLVLTFSHLGNSAVECISLSTKEGQPKEMKSWIIEIIAQLQAGQHGPFKSSMNSFKTAQKAFHQNPGDVRAMCTLASACHAEGILRKSFTSDLSLFLLEKALLASVMEKEKNDDDILCWCLRQLTLCAVELGNKAEAMEHLHKLKEHYPDTSPYVRAVELYLSSSVPSSISVSQLMDLDFLSLMISVSSLGNSGQYAVLIDLLKQVMDTDKIKTKSLSRTNLLEFLTNLAFEKIQAGLGTSELQKTFEDSVSYAKEKELGSPLMSLMHGINSFNSNKRLAKHMFATSLDQSQLRNDGGWCKTLARQGLLSLLWDSTKESDVQLCQALLQDITQDGDKPALDFYAQFAKK